MTPRPVHSGSAAARPVAMLLTVPLVSPALSDPGFRALRDRQSLVLSRAQLGAHQIGRQLIARRVAAEAWQPVGSSSTGRACCTPGRAPPCPG